MTSEPLTDVLAGLMQELAAVLRVEPERIEPQQRFQALGLDSIRTAELMAALNSRFGTGIVPDALYDHPTPEALARHVRAETATAPGPGPSAPADSAEADICDALRGSWPASCAATPRRSTPACPSASSAWTPSSLPSSWPPSTTPTA